MSMDLHVRYWVNPRGGVQLWFMIPRMYSSYTWMASGHELMMLKALTCLSWQWVSLLFSPLNFVQCVASES